MQNGETNAGPVVFDRERALAGVDGDLELLGELAGLFLEDVQLLVDRLVAAADAGDTEGVRIAAHTLKGSVGVLAAHEMAGLAVELERMGREGDLTAARATHPRLQEALDRLTPILAEFADD